MMETNQDNGLPPKLPKTEIIMDIEKKRDIRLGIKQPQNANVNKRPKIHLLMTFLREFLPFW